MDLKKTSEALEKFGKFVVRKSKSNLKKQKKGDGSLYNSIGYDLDAEQNAFLLDFMMFFSHQSGSFTVQCAFSPFGSIVCASLVQIAR